MKKIFTLAFVALTLLATACGKSNNDNPNPQDDAKKALADAIRRASKRKDSKSKDTDSVNATPSDKNIEDVINKKAAEYK